MSIFIITTLILALVALFTYYFYQEAKRKSASQAARKTLTARIERLKRSFKAKIQDLVSLGVLSKQGQDTIYRLPNYYFVFQPITLENVEHCEHLLGSLLNVINDKLLSESETSDVPNSVQVHLNHFVCSLPSMAKDYHASFYRNDLPVLIKKLMDAQVDDAPVNLVEENAIQECTDGING